jgi:pyruvate,water dikinase
MSVILSIADISTKDIAQVGGKALALAEMQRYGLQVPYALCITTDAYSHYLRQTRLQEFIALELNRKPFQDMRWEELWDTSFRIQNMFLKTPIPHDLKKSLGSAIASAFSSKSTAVRSSAPGEDSTGASFAGLHESYVNIKDPESILEHTKLVWASVWSDRALLYRQEVGLNVEKSTMAVVVQEMVLGDRSGVVFSINPNDVTQAVIEAVHGLNQGLVDGMVEPDRWIVDRKTAETVSYQPAQRSQAMLPAGNRVQLEPLDPGRRDCSPLNSREVDQVYQLVLQTEKCFGSPQDVEWTFLDDRLYVLQSRPITTTTGQAGDDERSWYLSLHRSFDNLKVLCARIEGTLLPAMDKEAQQLSEQPIERLSDTQLVEEIQKRSNIYEKWSKTYWDEFIPMAHGMRLFGEVYNRMIRPDDPYEFMCLLGATDMLSLRRNNMLAKMASMIRKNPNLAATRENENASDEHRAFLQALDNFLEGFGDLVCGNDQCRQGRDGLIKLLVEMAGHEPKEKRPRVVNTGELKQAFLDRFAEEDRDFGSDLLALGRASYQLRDDDNIYIGRIRSQMTRTLDEGKDRIRKRLELPAHDIAAEEMIAALRDPAYIPKVLKTIKQSAKSPQKEKRVQARQLVGQPAGPGIGKGKARVIETASELVDFKAGDVLVCDALDPTMTFVVPLSAGIVERRGGMLIHGAIIAREYGLPCVTGVPDATIRIDTGDVISVDGYLGIVTIHSDQQMT